MSMQQIAAAIRQSFHSPSVADLNGESANVVDVLNEIALAIRAHADAIDRLGGTIAQVGGDAVECTTRSSNS